jgi:hypothetical protein
VIHVVLEKGIQPLVLHHVRRQTALFTPVLLGVFRGNDWPQKLHWTSLVEFHQATADYRASHGLICGHEGMLTVTSSSTETPPASCHARTPMRMVLPSRERLKRTRVLINENASVTANGVEEYEVHCDVPWHQASPYPRKEHTPSRGERTEAIYGNTTAMCKLLFTQILTYSLRVTGLFDLLAKNPLYFVLSRFYLNRMNSGIQS